MKKLAAIIITLALAVLLAGCAAGAAENTELTAQYIPEGAQFVKSETDDGFTEYEYRTDAGDEYTLLTDTSGNVRALKYDGRTVSAATESTLSAEDAFARIKEQHPDARLITSVEDSDDGRLEWDILFSSESLLGFYELDAATGDVLDYTIFYSLSEAIDPAAIIAANIADARITELSMEADDGRLVITGSAASANGNIEFTIDAASGTVTEFDFDD